MERTLETGVLKIEQGIVDVCDFRGDVNQQRI